jgi:hypothetical protein
MHLRLTGFSVFFCAITAAQGLYAAQPLTKVVMTTGSFSEREAAMDQREDRQVESRRSGRRSVCQKVGEEGRF